MYVIDTWNKTLKMCVRASKREIPRPGFAQKMYIVASIFVVYDSWGLIFHYNEKLHSSNRAKRAVFTPLRRRKYV